MKIIFDYNRTLYNPENKSLYKDSADLLEKLSKQHDLFLISKKEQGREQKIEALGIKDFFKKIVFVKTKTTTIFRELCLDDTNCLVVGDRVRSEIVVGNRCGLITVWLKQGVFSKEIPKTLEEEPKHEISNLKELENIIAIYDK